MVVINLLDRVTVNLDMLCAFMVDKDSNNLDDTSVVCM